MDFFYVHDNKDYLQENPKNIFTLTLNLHSITQES